jgi:exosortase
MSQESTESASGRVGIASTRCRGIWTWRHWAAAAVLLVGAVVATHDAWRDILDIAWGDAEQSQVFLVPFVAAWLFWVRRERLRGYRPRATWVGPVVVAAGWVVNRAGDAYLIQSVWHFGAVVVLVGAFLSVAGGEAFRRFSSVFVALVFLVPVPQTLRQAIAIPLQAQTAALTQSALELFGVAVERSGNLLTINHQEVMIAEACNGLRMVFALVMVTFAFAYGSPLRNAFRIFLLALTPVTAIAFNVVRLVPTVWSFGLFSPSVANTIHDLSAWVMLPVALLALLGILRLLRWAQLPVSPFVLAYGS